jgi:TonB family protein
MTKHTVDNQATFLLKETQESIKEKSFQLTQAMVVTDDELVQALAAIQEDELRYEREHEEKRTSFEENLKKIDEQRLIAEKTLAELKQKNSLLESAALALSKNLRDDHHQQQEIKKKLIKTQHEIDRLEKIQDMAQKIFEEKMKTDLSFIQHYRKKIAYHLSSYWKIPYHDEKTKLQCTLDVGIIPNGEVSHVVILEGSGDEAFDQHAINAIYKSSPLPFLEELMPKQRPRKLTITFVPESVSAMESFL